MNEFLDKVDVWLTKVFEFAKAMTIEQWAMAGGGLLVLILLRWVIKRANRPKKSTTKQKAAPISAGLNLYTFQIAPLGRDAFLKVQNRGEEVTLTKLEILDRQNIIVKNALSGHKLSKDKIYSILLEAEGNSKITDGFSVQVSYLSNSGKVAMNKFIAIETKMEKTAEG